MNATVTPAKVPFWEDLLEIFYAPRTVFERRKDSGFWLALIVLVLVMTGLYYAGRNATQPVFDAEFDRSMVTAQKQNPAMTPDQVEKGRTIMHSFAGVGITGYALIAPLLVGLMLWIAGKFVGARQELGAACMVAVYAFYPRLLDGLLGLLQCLVLPSDSLTSHYALQIGPARFVDPDQHGVLIAILGRLDLATIWCTVLLAIGLSVTGKITMKNAAIAAGIVWLAGCLLPLWGALRAAG
ncbi:MAG: YIP1 family protein [Gemmatimonadota bacterium]